MKALYRSTGRRAQAIQAISEAVPEASTCTTHQKTSQWETMEDNDLQALMARLELLINRVEQLKTQNGLLLAQEKTWREERAHLIEKNEIARQKVESMISRLKALEQDS